MAPRDAANVDARGSQVQDVRRVGVVHAFQAVDMGVPLTVCAKAMTPPRWRRPAWLALLALACLFSGWQAWGEGDRRGTVSSALYGVTGAAWALAEGVGYLRRRREHLDAVEAVSAAVEAAQGEEGP